MDEIQDFLSNYLYSENLTREQVGEVLYENIDELNEIMTNLLNE